MLVQRKTVTESFHFELTESEKIDYAAKVAVAIQEKEEIEDDFAAAKKSYAGQIKKKEGEIYRLCQAINHGEDRQIKCVKEIEGEKVRFILNGCLLKERSRQKGEGELDEVEDRGAVSDDF